MDTLIAKAGLRQGEPFADLPILPVTVQLLPNQRRP